MNKIIHLLLILTLALGLGACLAPEAPLSQQGSATSDQAKAQYQKLTAEEAKKIIDENPEAIVLDVRTATEYQEKHLANALLIPDNELAKRAETELPDLEATILIYCRSGNRSKSAANTLIQLGYTQVYDFGGLNTYPYEIVSE